MNDVVVDIKKPLLLKAIHTSRSRHCLTKVMSHVSRQADRVDLIAVGTFPLSSVLGRFVGVDLLRRVVDCEVVSTGCLGLIVPTLCQRQNM